MNGSFLPLISYSRSARERPSFNDLQLNRGSTTPSYYLLTGDMKSREQSLCLRQAEEAVGAGLS